MPTRHQGPSWPNKNTTTSIVASTHNFCQFNSFTNLLYSNLCLKNVYKHFLLLSLCLPNVCVHPPICNLRILKSQNWIVAQMCELSLIIHKYSSICVVARFVSRLDVNNLFVTRSLCLKNVFAQPPSGPARVSWAESELLHKHTNLLSISKVSNNLCGRQFCVD